MKIIDWQENNLNEIVRAFGEGEAVVIPSDTLYGIMASAKNEKAVSLVYELKGRRPDKPAIILISEASQIKDFGIEPSSWQRTYLDKYWPGKVSIVLPCGNKDLEYLHRGTYSLAFRLPDDKILRDLIAKTGPLIAPSANPEGVPTPDDIQGIQNIFGERIKHYVDGGPRISEPSTLISLINDKVEVLRGTLKDK